MPPDAPVSSTTLAVERPGAHASPAGRPGNHVAPSRPLERSVERKERGTRCDLIDRRHAAERGHLRCGLPSACVTRDPALRARAGLHCARARRVGRDRFLERSRLTRIAAPGPSSSARRAQRCRAPRACWRRRRGCFASPRQELSEATRDDRGAVPQTRRWRGRPRGRGRRRRR